MFKMVFDIPDQHLLDKIRDAAHGLTVSRKYHYIEVIFTTFEDTNGNMGLDFDEVSEFLKRLEKLTVSG